MFATSYDTDHLRQKLSADAQLVKSRKKPGQDAIRLNYSSQKKLI